MPTSTGKLADPEWRRQRAVNAARARNSIDAHIAALERDVNGLTTEHLARLAELVHKARGRSIKRDSNGIAHCEGQRTWDDHLNENGVHV